MIYQYSRFIVCFLLILFPSLSNLIEHSGSIILVLLTLFGLSVAFSSEKRPLLSTHEKWVMWAFVAYFLAYLLSFSFNGLLGNLPDPRFKHIEHELRIVSIVPIFYLLRYLKVSQSIVWTSITAGALIAGGYAIYSVLLLNAGARVSGSYHEIAFGDLSLALAFMNIVSIDWYKRKGNLYIFVPIIALLLGVLASIMSGTRGAWIAMPTLFCVFFFYSGKFLKIGPRLLIAGTCCVLVVVAYKIPATRIADRIELVTTEINDYADGRRVYTATTTRIEGWRAALDIFMQNPLFGAGPETYDPLLQEMVAKGIRHEIAARHDQPHSAYFSTMADCGIIGLFALLAIFGMPLWSAIICIRSDQKIREFGYAMIMLVMAFAHFGLTETMFSRNVNINFYVIMLASLMAAAANEKAEE